MKFLSNLNPLLRRGVIGAVLLPILYIIIDAIMGILSRQYFFPASILLFIQLILLGFIIGIITAFLKYKIKNNFLISTKAKIILFYSLLVPATILPSLLFPMAMCCDCFGPACTTIHGFPFPALISGEVMNVYPSTLSIILLTGTIGFILNILLYYLISSTFVFLSKFFRTNKKIFLAVIVIIILLFFVKSLFNERTYDFSDTENFEEGKIYRLVETSKDYDIFQHAIYENKIAYLNIGEYTYMNDEIYILNLDTKQQELLAQDKDMEINVLGLDNDKVAYITWIDGSREGGSYRSQGYINIIDINDKTTKRYTIPEKYMSVSGVLSLDFQNDIIVWDDKIPIPAGKTYKPEVYSYINIDTMERIVINESQDKEHGAFSNGEEIVFNNNIYDKSNNMMKHTGEKIIIYDITSGKSITLAGELDERATDLFNNKIVLERRSKDFKEYEKEGDSDIFIYDMDTKQYQQVTNNKKHQRDGKLYRDYVVWTDYRHGDGEIYLKDLSTGKETRITKSSKLDYSPEIAGNKIVWKRRSLFGKTELLLYIIPHT